MRVGVDARSLQEPKPSGVSVYTRELLRALQECGDGGGNCNEDLELVLFLNSAGLRRNPRRVGEIKKSVQTGVVPEMSAKVCDETGTGSEWLSWQVHYWPNKIFSFSQIVGGWPQAEWMFGRAPDVIFIPNMQFFPFSRCRHPYVLTVHDLSFERYPDCLDFRGRARHGALRPRGFITGAAHIIAVSQHTKHDLEQLYGVDGERISVVYSGVNHGEWNWSSEEFVPSGMVNSAEVALRQQLHNKKIIFSLSTMEPRKNILGLIAAFNILRREFDNLHLVVAGGRGWKTHDVYKVIRQTPHVHYLGYVREQAKKWWYQHAAVFVYPSLYEGFGFPPLEAQTVGVPVVAGVHSSLMEVLGNSAMLVDVHDVNALMRGVSDLLRHSFLATELVERGKNNARRFSWQKAATQTYQILQKVYEQKKHL